MFSFKENRKGSRYFLHRNSLAGYSTVSAAKSAAAPLKHDWTARESQPDLTAENTWPPKSRASPKSFTYLMSPSIFWGSRRKGENTNKHYFQILGTLHYSAEGQMCKAICMNSSWGFSSGELQFCRPAAVLPTNFAAIAVTKLLCPTLQEHQENGKTKQKQSRKRGQASASGTVFPRMV